MTITSLLPFVPSGAAFERSAALFTALGFEKIWDAGDYIGFEKNSFGFILQKFNNKEFAENFMISVGVPDADAFYREVKEKQLQEEFGVRISEPNDMPYGREVNMIDIAGVCWHFVGPVIASE
jgi:hypothetical protein